MTRQATFETIQKTIRSLLPGSRIVLFGSHARGDYDNQSDYDLLVITPNPLTSKEKISWSSRLDRAIVNAIHAPVDLLLYSEDEILQKQLLPGHIVRSAIREGIVL